MTNRPTRNQLAKTIAKRMNSKVSSKKLAREVAAYLISEGRTTELEPLMRDVIKARSGEGIIESTAVSAGVLSSQVQRALMKLSASRQSDYKQVIINQEQDPSLLGGVHLISADMELDLTLSSKLGALSKSINTERNQ